jgi:hypothetical protein
MKFSEVLKALNGASAFELYRMRAAIDRVFGAGGKLRVIGLFMAAGPRIPKHQTSQ